jgi:hypothetical protein
MKIAILYLFIVSLIGCSSNKNVLLFKDAPVPQLQNDKAILYIYRDYAEPTGLSSYLEIDSIEVASLDQKNFTWVYIEPGEHNFIFGWPSYAGMPNVNFNHSLEAGKSYAFHMVGDVGHIHKSGIEPIKIDVAKSIIKNCCNYVSPSN